VRTLATWNVNSLRVRLPQVSAWLAATPVDLLAMQETKLTDAEFPRAEFDAAGWHCAFSGQKSYNGVAIASREPLADIVTDLPGFEDPSRRVLAASTLGVRVINLYVPNGQAVGSEKYEYKLRWLAALHAWLTAEAARHPLTVVMGDFNIAPQDRDVHDPAAWAGSVHVSAPERAALGALLGAGFVDVFRLFEQPEKSYSWWDYRMLAFRRNHGLRIDLVLATPALARLCTTSRIDREPRRAERPSDHAPVLASFDI
jgi:exodeoxyribonuclease III